jgi:hypothetical protein
MQKQARWFRKGETFVLLVAVRLSTMGLWVVGLRLVPFEHEAARSAMRAASPVHT